MALYKLVDKQVYAGQEVRNVYWYESATGGSAEDLVNAFVADVLAPVLLVQVLELSHTEIEAYDVESETDWHTEALVGATGDLEVNGAAPFISYGIRLNRTTRATRSGFKRLAGVPEDRGTLGLLSPGEIAPVQTAADAMADPISLLGTTYNPVIVGLVRDEEREVIDYITNPISSASVQPNLTTQNSRKRGRGA